MKKTITFLGLILTAIVLSAQSQTFMKCITNHYDNNSYSVKEGIDHNYYLQSYYQDSAYQLWKEKILKINQQGNVVDSMDLSVILNKGNYSWNPYFENYHDHMFYATSLGYINTRKIDTTKCYLYARIFDTAFNIIKEAIIDTVSDSEEIFNHLVNRKGNHVFLIAK